MAKTEKDDDPCWEGYEMRGMKENEDGEMVPNCVPVDDDGRTGQKVYIGDESEAPQNAEVKEDDEGLYFLSQDVADAAAETYPPEEDDSEYEDWQTTDENEYNEKQSLREGDAVTVRGKPVKVIEVNPRMADADYRGKNMATGIDVYFDEGEYSDEPSTVMLEDQTGNSKQDDEPIFDDRNVYGMISTVSDAFDPDSGNANTVIDALTEFAPPGVNRGDVAEALDGVFGEEDGASVDDIASRLNEIMDGPFNLEGVDMRDFYGLISTMSAAVNPDEAGADTIIDAVTDVAPPGVNRGDVAEAMGGLFTEEDGESVDEVGERLGPIFGDEEIQNSKNQEAHTSDYDGDVSERVQARLTEKREVPHVVETVGFEPDYREYIRDGRYQAAADLVFDALKHDGLLDDLMREAERAPGKDHRSIIQPLFEFQGIEGRVAEELMRDLRDVVDGAQQEGGRRYMPESVDEHRMRRSKRVQTEKAEMYQLFDQREIDLFDEILLEMDPDIDLPVDAVDLFEDELGRSLSSEERDSAAQRAEERFVDMRRPTRDDDYREHDPRDRGVGDRIGRSLKERVSRRLGERSEEDFRNMDSDELRQMRERLMEQHSAAREGRRVRGGRGTDTTDDELMRDILHDVRMIDDVLMDRGEKMSKQEAEPGLSWGETVEIVSIDEDGESVTMEDNVTGTTWTEPLSEVEDKLEVVEDADHEWLYDLIEEEYPDLSADQAEELLHGFRHVVLEDGEDEIETAELEMSKAAEVVSFALQKYGHSPDPMRAYEEAYDRVVNQIDLRRYAQDLVDEELVARQDPSKRELADMARDRYSFEVEPEIRSLLSRDFDDTVIPEIIDEFEERFIDEVHGVHEDIVSGRAPFRRSQEQSGVSQASVQGSTSLSQQSMKEAVLERLGDTQSVRRSEDFRKVLAGELTVGEEYEYYEDGDMSGVPYTVEYRGQDGNRYVFVSRALQEPARLTPYEVGEFVTLPSGGSMSVRETINQFGRDRIRDYARHPNSVEDIVDMVVRETGFDGDTQELRRNVEAIVSSFRDSSQYEPARGR